MLKYQNKEFKQFYADYGLFLEKSDKIFRLYILLLDTLRKIRFSINCIIVDKEKNRYYLTKNKIFDILTLTNQLQRLEVTYSDRPKCDKIYFLENQVANIVKLGLEHLP